ncbi:MAG: hypothetical protein C0594_01360 [Marinilabiliales bacterium]|nr:MAG: hypothetical protein C0594_01360 [Marinilabiliales bacterium]
MKHNANILIVDDQVDNQLLLSDFLEALGYGYSVASNGKQALELFIENNFDMILMDLEMPVMNGVETTVYIRTHFKGAKANTPIVAITAHCPYDYQEKYSKKGFSDFLSKPYTIDKIESTIHKFL